MSITRREALAVAVLGGLGVSGTVHAGPEPLTPDQSLQLTPAERSRLEESGPAVVKQFIAALREHFSDETAGELRRFIDPLYIAEHNLQDGAFPVQRPVTGAIYDNQLSDDPRTALIVAETKDAAKECFLFRLTIHEDSVYLQPLLPPDETSRSFRPWILRVHV
jgi:hypothetical protein